MRAIQPDLSHRAGMLSAPWPVFVRLLAAVRQATARMLVDELTLSSSRIRGIDNGSILNSSFTVFAFAAGPSDNQRR